MEKKYSVVASKFIGRLGEGDNEIFTYEITFNRSLEHTGKFKGIEDGLNSYALTPMEKEYFVKVDVKDELPTEQKYYMTICKDGNYHVAKRLPFAEQWYSDSGHNITNHVTYWLKPISFAR